jgi:hypothetical protein
VGLVFYDLKTLLRQLGDGEGAAASAPADSTPADSAEGGDA